MKVFTKEQYLKSNLSSILTRLKDNNDWQKEMGRIKMIIDSIERKDSWVNQCVGKTKEEIEEKTSYDTEDDWFEEIEEFKNGNGNNN